MKTIKHPSAIRLLKRIIEQIPLKSKGTYNYADPTYYEKGEICRKFKNIGYIVRYYDCTWGIELEIQSNNKLIGSFYLSWDFGNKYEIVPRQNKKGLIKLLVYLFPETLSPDFKSLKQIQYEKEMQAEYFEDPMGCISDYV